MDFRSPRLLNVAVLLVYLVGLVSAQVPSARAILEVSEAEQTKFVNETMDAGFPDDRADQMTMLVINRSVLVLPLIERRVEDELRSQSPSKNLIATGTEMIAYAGDERALREVSKLVHIDDNRFGPLVARTLDNALNFRNPFALAYRGYEFRDTVLARHIAVWSNGALSSTRMQRLFGEAMNARYKRVPGEREWASDPIASRITSSQRREQLKESVLKFASEANTKRERQ
jgi:hypothetical protein